MTCVGNASSRLSSSAIRSASRVDDLPPVTKELTLENAASIKKLQQARRDYDISNAQFYALYGKLKLLGINPDSLQAEKLNPYAYLLAPAAGKLTKISVNAGMFCNEN